MRKLLLVALSLVFAASGTAMAQECKGCATDIFGYMAPYFMMHDKGEDNAANLGFGMAYNRVVWSGKVDVGEIVKKAAWRVEMDFNEAGANSDALQYAYVQPYFNDKFSIIMGRDKKPFSLEVLYSTANQFTAWRHMGSSQMAGLGYASFSYGLSANVKHDMFYLKAGVYEGGGRNKSVSAQDPALDYGARFVLTPKMEDMKLEVGLNAMMTTIPAGGKDQGTYPDTDDDEYLSNSGMAFGADVNLQKDFGEMSLLFQGEFDTGDNWMVDAEPGDEGDTWEDATFYKWQYLYAKAKLMVNKQFGVYAALSIWDPNTGTDEVTMGEVTYEVGENNETTTIIPGVIYYWSKNLRTMVEVQLVTTKNQAMDAEGDWVDDTEYTHFVLQQVFIWP